MGNGGLFSSLELQTGGQPTAGWKHFAVYCTVNKRFLPRSGTWEHRFFMRDAIHTGWPQKSQMSLTLLQFWVFIKEIGAKQGFLYSKKGKHKRSVAFCCLTPKGWKGGCKDIIIFSVSDWTRWENMKHSTVYSLPWGFIKSLPWLQEVTVLASHCMWFWAGLALFVVVNHFRLRNVVFHVLTSVLEMNHFYKNAKYQRKNNFSLFTIRSSADMKMKYISMKNRKYSHLVSKGYNMAFRLCP